MSEQRVRAFLTAQGIEPEIRRFDDTHSAQAAADALGVQLSQISKSILFVYGPEPRAAIVMTAGDRRIEQSRLKTLLGAKPRMATPDEVLAFTGYPVGAVTPFALATPVPVYLDTSLADRPAIWLAGGTTATLLRLSWEQLLRLTRGTQVDLSTVLNQ